MQSCGSWALNPGPLEEEKVLLTIEPSLLEPLVSFSYFFPFEVLSGALHICPSYYGLFKTLLMKCCVEQWKGFLCSHQTSVQSTGASRSPWFATTAVNCLWTLCFSLLRELILSPVYFLFLGEMLEI